MGAGVLGIDLIHHGVKALLNGFLENVLLLGVIVAAASGQQQNAQGLRRVACLRPNRPNRHRCQPRKDVGSRRGAVMAFL